MILTVALIYYSCYKHNFVYEFLLFLITPSVTPFSHFATSTELTPTPFVHFDQWNETFNDTIHDGHSVCCEQETMLVITLSAVFGVLLVLLLVLTLCIVLLVRRAKMHRRGCMRQSNFHSARRVSLPCLLQLHTNTFSGASSLLGLEKRGSSQPPLSPFTITDNPSYSTTTAFLDSRPRSPDGTKFEHQYDDIVNFPGKNVEEPEVYDRLEPISLGTHNYENSSVNMPQEQCTPASSAPPAVVSTVSHTPLFSTNSDPYEQYYVNEMDGPSPTIPRYKPKPPLPSLPVSKSSCDLSPFTPSQRQVRTFARHRPREYEVPITRNHTFKW